MAKYLVIEVAGWENESGRTYTQTYYREETELEKENMNLDWNAIIGLDNSTPEEWKEHSDYEKKDTIWIAKIVTEDEDGEPISEELIEEVYESDIVEKWME